MGKTQKRENLTRLGLDLIDEIERNWNMNKLYLITIVADLIASFVITYLTFLIYKLPQEYFWTVMVISIKPYFTTSFYLISRTQKGKITNILTKVMDETLRIRDMAEWQIELAAIKPESVGRIQDSNKNVSIWNTSNEKLGFIQKVKDLEAKDKIREKKIIELEKQINQKPAEVKPKA